MESFRSAEFHLAGRSRCNKKWFTAKRAGLHERVTPAQATTAFLSIVMHSHPDAIAIAAAFESV